MKNEHIEEVGSLRIILRQDGGVYLAEVEPQDTRPTAGYSRVRAQEPMRVGTSSAICSALSAAFARMAEHIRSQPKRALDDPDLENKLTESE